MFGIRLPVALTGVAVVVAMLVGLGYYLLDTQADARAGIRQELNNRARIVAGLTADAVTGEQQVKTAEAYFSGPERRMAKALVLYQGADPAPRVIVLDARGRVLAATPRALREDRSLLSRNRHLRIALRGRIAVSDVYAGADGSRLIDLAVPFSTKHGRRVLATATTLDVIQAFATGYLASAPGVRAAQGHLLDGNLKIVATAGRAALGSPLPDHELAAALRGAPQGTYGNRHFVSAPIRGTSWRIVFSVPTGPLYAPVDGPARKAAWQLFGLFAVALLALLAIGAAALRRSARLAHERLHDPLTGLPNRALFLDRTSRALLRLQRERGCVAMVFLDLDRFKAINDSLGHASGDRVLKAVADRLRECLRAGDTVARFGGDEFLVLCEGLHTQEEAQQVAARIQQALDEPITIANEQVAVACSIGVATHSSEDLDGDPAQLIDNADLAMYAAKQRGRGGVEYFGSTTASPIADSSGSIVGTPGYAS